MDMVQIKIDRLGKSANFQNPVNLMQALLDMGLPVASSCGGVAVCGKCRIRIVSGGENLNPPNEDEKFLIEKERLEKDERISCQVEVRGPGPICVDTKYW